MTIFCAKNYQYAICFDKVIRKYAMGSGFFRHSVDYVNSHSGTTEKLELYLCGPLTYVGPLPPWASSLLCGPFTPI